MQIIGLRLILLSMKKTFLKQNFKSDINEKLFVINYLFLSDTIIDKKGYMAIQIRKTRIPSI